MAEARAEGSSRSKRTRRKSPPKKPKADTPDKTEQEQADEQPAEEAPAEEEPVDEDVEAADEEPIDEDVEAVDEPPIDEDVEESEEAARRAARYVADLTGKRAESVVSLERSDGGWKVGVEVVESPRIPDTKDILATYEVVLERGAVLRSYRRTRRYARGQLDRR